MIDTLQLIPTHNRLRDLSSFYYFKDNFKTSRVFDCEPIVVVQTEDGLRYLWDSHHRCAAWVSIGGQFIPDNQMIIKQYTYQQINEINYFENYVTPFDIKNECRLPDFSFFKSKCLGMSKELKSENSVTNFILQNKRYYVEPRLVYNIKHLLELSGL